jgi:hypothetical protein
MVTMEVHAPYHVTFGASTYVSKTVVAVCQGVSTQHTTDPSANTRVPRNVLAEYVTSWDRAHQVVYPDGVVVTVELSAIPDVQTVCRQPADVD